MIYVYNMYIYIYIYMVKCVYISIQLVSLLSCRMTNMHLGGKKRGFRTVLGRDIKDTQREREKREKRKRVYTRLYRNPEEKKGRGMLAILSYPILSYPIVMKRNDTDSLIMKTMRKSPESTLWWKHKICRKPPFFSRKMIEF